MLFTIPTSSIVFLPKNMKLIKTCIFPLLFVLILLFISHHISATETSKDGKKGNNLIIFIPYIMPF